MLAIWSLVPLSFLNPAWTSGSSQFTVEAGLENFEHYFTSVWDEHNCVVVWAFFGITFLWNWNKNLLFPVLLLLLSFPNLLAYWVQHFHSTIFWDLKWLNWNSITSTSFVCRDASYGPLDFTFQDEGAWSHHHHYLGHENIFSIVLLCILATSS